MHVGPTIQLTIIQCRFLRMPSRHRRYGIWRLQILPLEHSNFNTVTMSPRLDHRRMSWLVPRRQYPMVLHFSHRILAQHGIQYPMRNRSVLDFLYASMCIAILPLEFSTLEATEAKAFHFQQRTILRHVLGMHLQELRNLRMCMQLRLVVRRSSLLAMLPILEFLVLQPMEVPLSRICPMHRLRFPIRASFLA